tara:strand:+ start:690 stop:923 length:234 start_codon:yes stop_codon:yes gene_type:complete
MLGTIIKYVGLSEGERYPAFIGHIGYVTSYTLAEKSSDGNTHVEVRWFEPRPARTGGGSIAYSHFGLERFEVLSESG